MATEENARRVAEAHSLGYEPQSPTKKLGPWGSGAKKHIVILDILLNKLEDKRIEDFKRDMLGYDEDVGYYNYNEYNN